MFINRQYYTDENGNQLGFWPIIAAVVSIGASMYSKNVEKQKQQKAEKKAREAQAAADAAAKKKAKKAAQLITLQQITGKLKPTQPSTASFFATSEKWTPIILGAGLAGILAYSYSNYKSKTRW